MRGFPFFNLLICLLLSGAVLLPLVLRATHIAPRTATVEKKTPAPSERTIRCVVTVKFVHAPQSLKLSAGDRVVADWTNADEDLRWEESLDLPADGKRLEFSLAVKWPDKTPDTIAEVTVEPEGSESKAKNLWSSGAAADEVISLTWEGTQP